MDTVRLSHYHLCIHHITLSNVAIMFFCWRREEKRREEKRREDRAEITFTLLTWWDLDMSGETEIGGRAVEEGNVLLRGEERKINRFNLGEFQRKGGGGATERRKRSGRDGWNPPPPAK